MNMFWGVFFILLGFSMIFPFNIPIFKIALAIFFFYMGLQILLGGFGINIKNKENTIMFKKSKVEVSSKFKEYNIVFGSGVIDLRGLNIEEIENIEINIVFGNATVIVDKNIMTEMKISTVFGSSSLPNGSSSFFGDTNFIIGDNQENKKLSLDCSVVFGSLQVVVNS
ncbi:MAG: hypothetical protein PWP46_693 [Fusobacteriaceae bacterium]|nr:hypothetical protein [Fusobacteriaceae bacterium]